MMEGMMEAYTAHAINLAYFPDWLVRKCPWGFLSS